MNDFKKGDRVEYVGPNLEIKQLGALTVTKVKGGGTVEVNDQGWTAVYYPNLRHVTPAPDVITIDRADLPEVVEVHQFLRADGFDYTLTFSATQHRRRALAQLAVSEFLAAREKAEQDAADKEAADLNKRRDELAVELFDQPGYKAHPEPFNYQDATPVVRAAINRIIQLELAVKK